MMCGCVARVQFYGPPEFLAGRGKIPVEATGSYNFHQQRYCAKFTADSRLNA
jgi:hypothetical protein